ncbi:PAS domain-containing protein [Hymenobacter sp. CRA2]|uniref:PAS domain-containing protein n=1 Tax=Hymenobacter sp. CRA2 TaxID=1955620 RepID=UPI001115B505|nr:PAS domain-containing protein [Hymenobacter sp. CRA2]
MASSFPDAVPADAFLPALLELSVSGVVCYAPLTDATGQIVDFAFAYLNPAAQRVLGLPAQPATTYREVFPEPPPFAAFAFHCEAYSSAEPRHFELNYQGPDHDTYCRVNGRRLGQHLLVSFSFSQEQDRNAVEQALRQSQAHARAARAQAEAQRAELTTIFEQAPAAIAIFEGPDHVIKLANRDHLALWGKTAADVLDKPLFEALPEFRRIGYEELLMGVMQTGEPYVAKQMSANLTRDGQRAPVYFDFVYQPWRNMHGVVTGVIVVATEITQQVVARQQAVALQAEALAVAERRAQERETFYQVFEQTPASIVLLRGPEHRVEYHNEAYQQLFPGRRMRGRTIAEIQPDAAQQGFLALLDRVYQTGETFVGRELPLAINQPDGQRRETYFNFTYQPYRENGQVTGISVFAYDVTEQVLTRQAREAQQHKFYTLFEQAPTGICILAGPELVFEFVNPSYQLLLPERELLGRPVFEALPEIEHTAVAAMLRGVYATGHTHEEQAMLVPLARPADGALEDRYFTFIYQARRDDLGRIDGILAFVFEVTAQQQAIAAVRESEARFRIMADAAPNQVWAVNPDSSIRYANQAFLDFVGVENLEQYAATGWSAYLPAEELHLAQRTLADAIRTRSMYALEHRMRRHDGEYRWLLAQGAPSFYPNGELYGYVGSAIDITALKQANEQLTRTNRDLDNFVYAASHDLKQPVNNLALLLQELRRGVTFADPAEEQLLMPMVQEALQQLSNTIDELAALGQAQQMSHAPAEQVSLAELTAEVVGTLEPQVQAARARITTDFAARPALSFARANLRTILLNLLGNALKYADPARPARIHVSVQMVQGRCVLTVEDNGLGFDAQKYGAELFQLFRRLHTHAPGSGVGLYLVKRIVEASGGSVEVESQPGEGATFRIRLGTT